MILRRREPAGGVSRAPVMEAVAFGAVLAFGSVACGGSSEREAEAVLDTLGLLDRELDLVMSGESATAELRDEARAAERSPAALPASRPPVATAPPEPARGEPRASGPSEETVGEAADEAADEAAEKETHAPTVVHRSISGGVMFEVSLNQELSTRHNRVGELFSATLRHPLTDGRIVVVPAGALVLGEITAVQESGGHGQPAIINLEVLEVSFDGGTYPLDGSIVEAHPETKGRSSTAAKAAKIGGAAAAGAILGRVIGGDALGTIIGTAVGGAAGTAIVLGTEDVDAVLPRGSSLVLRLDAPLELAVEVP